MPVIDPGWYASLPPELRSAIGLGVFIAAMWLAIKGYRGTPAASVQKTEDVKIVQGAFADVSPWRAIAASIERMAASSEATARDIKRCADGIEKLVVIREEEAGSAKIAKAVADALAKAGK